jgi:hypothetical protein
MKLKALAAGLVLAAAATPALAASWMAIDANTAILVMIDRASIERYGGVRVAKNLYVIKGMQPVVFTIRYNCDMQTLEEIDQRVVRKDMSLAPPVVGSAGTKPITPGSLGAAQLANVCQDKVVNASGGWTRPDLKSAIDAATSAGYAPAWP